MRLPAELKPEQVTAIIDTREQLAFDLDPLSSEPGTLAAGDYSVKGLEHLIAIERKSLPDLIACCGTERDRFERELQRLLAYPTHCVVVEASWSDLVAGGWRSQMTPQAATGSVVSWIGQGIPFLFAGDRLQAQRATAKMLYSAARRRWRELRTLHQSITGDDANG